MPIEAILLESVVSNFLWAIAKDWLVERRPRRFDFIVETDVGRRIALEVLSTSPTVRKLHHLKESIKITASRITEFVLITPDTPSQEDSGRLDEVFADINIPYRWIGLNELPEVFGVQSPGDMRTPETIAKIQELALVKNLAGYAKAPVGPEPRIREQPVAITNGSDRIKRR